MPVLRAFLRAFVCLLILFTLTPSNASVAEEKDGSAFIKEFVAVDGTLFDGVRKRHEMAVEAKFMDIK